MLDGKNSEQVSSFQGGLPSKWELFKGGRIPTVWSAKRFQEMERRLDSETRAFFSGADPFADGRWALLESLAEESTRRQFEAFLEAKKLSHPRGVDQSSPPLSSRS